MLRNFRLKKGQNKGIGLLELMLSLAIIAILLIMATRYYVSTEGAQKMQSAVEMVTAIRGAMKTSLAGTTGTPTTTPTIVSLTQSGLLPASFISGSGESATSETTNPWGKAMAIGTITDTTFEVTMTTPNTSICNSLAQQLIATQDTLTTTKETATCDGATLKASYIRQ